MIRLITASLLVLFCSTTWSATATDSKKHELGTPKNPIIISLLPERTSYDSDMPELPDFLKQTQQKLSFKLIQSKSYSQAVDDFCNNKTHVAVLGMVTYSELKKRCNIEELLAIEILEGKSVYHSGLFTHRKNLYRNNRTRSFHMLERKTIAFGSPYSTTAFHYPLKLLLDLDLSLPDDLDAVYMSGSHSAAIQKLARGEVALAAASFQSWKAAIDQGMIDPMLYMPLIKSGIIPLPPLVMNRFLPDQTKEKIRRVFREAHMNKNTEFIIGVRGRKIDRYDLEKIKEESYLNALRSFDSLELDLIERVLDKAYAHEIR